MAINDKVLFTVQPTTSIKIIAWLGFFIGIACLFLAAFKGIGFSLFINWNVNSEAEVSRNNLFAALTSIFTLIEGVVLFILFFGLRHLRRWALNLYTGFLILSLFFIGFLFIERMSELIIFDLIILVPFAVCWLYLWRKKTLFT